MTDRVIALFDYEAADDAELTIKENDVITILSRGEDGWWEGTLDGKTGLLPENYVAPFDAADQNNTHLQAEPVGTDSDFDSSDFDSDFESEPQLQRSGSQLQSSKTTPIPMEAPSDLHIETYSGNLASVSVDMDGRLHATRGKSVTKRTSQLTSTNAAAIGRTYNVFSSFVKTGAEEFLLGNFEFIATPEVLKIDASNDGPVWHFEGEPFNVTIAVGEKKSKYHSVKTYQDYQVFNTLTSENVDHRFKHFQWLHQQLTRKYKFLAIPPLPENSLFSNWTEDATNKRRRHLEMWLNRVIIHPILAHCPAVTLFMYKPENEKVWKKGKREVENSEIVNAQLFAICDAPVDAVSENVDSKVVTFKEFCSKHKQSLAKINSNISSIDSNSKEIKAHYEKYADSFVELAKGDEASMVCCWNQSCQKDKPLTVALLQTSQTYEWIGNTLDSRTAEHISSIEEFSREYTALIPQYDVISDVHTDGSFKKHEVAKMVTQRKVEGQYAQDVASRQSIISSITEAEMNHLHDTRRTDLKNATKEFLKKELAMYQEIQQRIEKALLEFDNVN